MANPGVANPGATDPGRTEPGTPDAGGETGDPASGSGRTGRRAVLRAGGAAVLGLLAAACSGPSRGTRASSGAPSSVVGGSTGPPPTGAAGGAKPPLVGLADMGGEPPAAYRDVVRNWVFLVQWNELQPHRQGEPVDTSAPTYTYSPGNGQVRAGRTLAQAVAACRAAGRRGKLRVLCGEYAPGWAKDLPYTDAAGRRQADRPVRTNTGTCGPFWQPWDPAAPHAGFLGAYHDLNVELARLYDADPVVVEVAVGATNAQLFAEPFVRQYNQPHDVDLANLWAAGLTGALDREAVKTSVDAVMAAWPSGRTRVSMALAPMHVAESATSFVTDNRIALTIAAAARARYGTRFVGGQNSYNSPPSHEAGKAAIYAWLSTHPPNYVQTVNTNVFTPGGGGLLGALAHARDAGYDCVELHPNQYPGLATPGQLAGYAERP